MTRHLNDFRRGAQDSQAMLRLPVGPEFWGVAGPHQHHDVPPLGVAAAARWSWRAARGLVAWLAAGLRRRGTAEPGGQPLPHPAR